ncbi:hypothetical protein O6H91_02G143300 [Diphasiastrum complanatum]|uniref:Uncharacterized protein n=2 Tax=Diphasiastrum complanatum TaxID=34168 RepID=A0ACC2ELU4_DIPCM|nr:hypothetical protein O6H91_02G143300 [Diphasiastrum complanatum]
MNVEENLKTRGMQCRSLTMTLPGANNCKQTLYKADDNSEYTYTVGKTFDTVMGLSVVTGRDSALSSDLCPCSTSSSCFMSLDLMGLTGLDAKTGIKTLLIAPTNAGNEEQVIKGSANSDDSDHLLSSEDLIRSLCTDSGMKGIPELDNITRTNDRTTCRYKEILSYSAVENEDGVQAFFQVAEEVSKDCSVYLTVKNTDKYSLPTTLFTNKSTSTVASGENFGGKLVI